MGDERDSGLSLQDLEPHRKKKNREDQAGTTGLHGAKKRASHSDTAWEKGPPFNSSSFLQLLKTKSQERVLRVRLVPTFQERQVERGGPRPSAFRRDVVTNVARAASTPSLRGGGAIP